MRKNKADKYIIFRIINNNVVSSLDGQESEIVLMGKGISFQKKVGDYVDTNKIEKIFELKGKERSRYLDIVENIPSDILDLSMEFLDQARKECDIKVTSISYIMLADHIVSAIERAKDHIPLKNEMLTEIKRFYPNEFELGKKAIAMIESNYGVALPIDEAGFIAFHIINLSEGSFQHKNDERLKLVNKILEIVESYFDKKLDKDSYYYERFLTHLNFFSTRVFSSQNEEQKDDFLYRLMKIQYPEITKCVELVQEYLNYNYQINITSEEKGYLIIHINNLLKKSEIVT